MPQKVLRIRRPDDWHLHLRDNEMLAGVLPHSHHFGRALVMPNLVPPVVTGDDAYSYRARILGHTNFGRKGLKPFMTLYLTESTDPDDVEGTFATGAAVAVKLYPAGATTNSQSGVRDLSKVMPVLERMAKIEMPLCVHGEVTDPEVDIFDREAVFIDRVLEPLRRSIPGLIVIMEHITTKDGVDYVREGGNNLAGTLTVHHLILNRNDLLVGGIKPHFYCLPIVKAEGHRLALRKAATCGHPRLFFGSDSAPHAIHTKENACGCAGIFSAPVALPWLAQVFEEEGALERLEDFVSHNGARFYQQPLNEGFLELVRQEEPVEYPKQIETGAGRVVVFDPGMPLYWRVVA